MSDSRDQGAYHVSEPATIDGVVAEEGGRVTFARFMELALTHPALGYYSQADRLLWPHGDFATAPALSPFFNIAVAKLVTELVEAAAWTAVDAVPAAAAPQTPGRPMRPAVVELGGGEGHLAEGILRHWDGERPGLRQSIAYRIVEVAPRLRERQAAAVGGLARTGWDVGWGADLEQACAGASPAVVVGNEFLDALPVHLIDVTGPSLREMYVETTPAGLKQSWGSLSEPAAGEVELLFGTVDARALEALTEDGILEVRPAVAGLMERVAALMPRGSLISIDYGEWSGQGGQCCGAQECRGEVRRRRTVRGYFKQQPVTDLLARPGRQDLTADVDFAAVDLHGRRAGFETVLFATLAAFLRAAEAQVELEALRAAAAGRGSDPLETDRQATVLANLLDEDDLGGAFKVMLQVRE